MTDRTLLPGKCEHGVPAKAETGEMGAVMLNAVKSGIWTWAPGSQSESLAGFISEGLKSKRLPGYGELALK